MKFEEAAWSQDAQIRGEVVGDSLTVVNWVNGDWSAKGESFGEAVAALRRRVVEVFAGAATPATNEASPLRHVFRELNQKADRLAALGRGGLHKRVVSEQVWAWWQHRRLSKQGGHFRVWFDGSADGGAAGAGWWAEVKEQGNGGRWWPILAGCAPAEGDSQAAEVFACRRALEEAAGLAIAHAI